MIITDHIPATLKTPLNPKATEYFPKFTTQQQQLPLFYHHIVLTITIHHPPIFIMIPSKTTLFNPLQLSPPLSPQKPDQGNYLIMEPGFTESGSAATEPTVVMVKKTRKPKIVGRVPIRADQSVSVSFWVQKDVVHHAELSSYPFGDSTSLMIRNIPIRLSRSELIELLDEHCRIENDKISPGQNDDEPPSEFDFLYLPIDFKRKGNLGYAFVNFTTWQGASRLYNAWKGNKWESCPYKTTKIAKICRAKYQGKKELIRHFEASVFRCDNDEYLPVEISHPRNGVNVDETQITTIGTRVW